MLELKVAFVVSLLTVIATMSVAIVVLAIQLRKAREQAMTDELTGFYNRHFIEQFLPKELAKADRSEKKEVTVICLDLDGFKSVNDKGGGHFAGDACLRAVAAAIRGVLRESDIVVRTGGDEFLVVATASRDEAATIAEKIRMAVETLDGIYKEVTASIGVACYPEIREARYLLQAADDAMYVSKSLGKNMVVMWGEEHS